ncbi:MAG TPA: cation:proton antiporter, partial [Gemmatimonadales bacterium]|nr:cation:proton antiporter [Gemmatimonadales bacterium]
MPGFELLRDLLILVAVAIPVVAIAQRLRAPTVVGFLITGIAIGPHALGLVRDVEAVRGLADIGVVLLLFAVGLELSLSRLMRMGRTMLVGGLVQVLGSAGVVAVMAVLSGAALDHAVVYGALVALSSTAIVLKTYTDRGELDTPYGRVVVAILLFQDLCVIPLVLLVRVLGARETGLESAAQVVGIGVVVIGALVFGGRLVIPWALERLVRLRNRELLTLGIVFIGLAAAYITASFGLSLALGAFIAGLVIAESEYGIQALSDVLPFRDVFSGIFFTSVGMLFDPAFTAAHGAAVAGAAGGILLLKTGTGTAATRALRRSTQVAVTAGVGLAQVGEFSFVLAGIALPLGLLTHDGYQLFLAASVLSMVIAPFAIAGARPLGAAVARLVRAPVVATPAPDAAEPLRDHVIIVGYGVNGRNLARVLHAAAIPYVILEQNGQVVRRARTDGEPIIFGDATRAEVLERVGVRAARVVVFAISAPAEELRGVAVARHLNPEI